MGPDRGGAAVLGDPEPAVLGDQVADLGGEEDEKPLRPRRVVGKQVRPGGSSAKASASASAAASWSSSVAGLTPGFGRPAMDEP